MPARNVTLKSPGCVISIQHWMGQSFIIAEAESSCGVAEVPGVTHIVYPFGPKGDPDDGQEYLRCLEKRCPVVCSSPSNHVELCILEDSCKLQALASAIVHALGSFQDCFAIPCACQPSALRLIRLSVRTAATCMCSLALIGTSQISLVRALMPMPGVSPPLCITGIILTATTDAFQQRWLRKSLSKTNASEASSTFQHDIDNFLLCHAPYG